MRPVALTTEAIDAAFKALSTGTERVTGVQVQAFLRQKHGLVGGTARVSRRIHELQRDQALLGRDRRIGQLEQQLLELEVALKAEQEQRAAATARAELAEERERGHQDRWASDVYELRQEVKALKAERAKSGVTADRYLDMHREVLSARARINVLETALRERASSDDSAAG